MMPAVQAARRDTRGNPAPPGATLRLTVAGVQLEFFCDDGLRLAAPGFEYPPFLAATDHTRRVPMRVERTAPSHLPADARLSFDTGDGWQLFARGPRRWLRMPRRLAGGSGTHGDCVWQVDWDEPLTAARVQVAADLVHDSIVHHLVQYPLDQILLTHVLLDQGALLVHAAGAAGTRAGGIAFPGVSGAGKSTLTRALMNAADLHFLSDDRVVLAPATHGYRLHGTPWAGDARVAEPGATPLTALCFLRQAASNAITPLDAAAALEQLLAVATIPWFDPRRMALALDAAARLLQRVPAYELAFSRDACGVPDLLESLADAA